MKLTQAEMELHAAMVERKRMQDYEAGYARKAEQARGMLNAETYRPLDEISQQRAEDNALSAKEASQRAWDIQSGRPRYHSMAYWTEVARKSHEEALSKPEDLVNHPSHYTSHPSGVECIQITEHMNFNLGNAVKYLWRADLKGDSIENLEKSVFYVQREITRRKKAAK